MIERRAGYRLVCTGCERSLGEAFVPFCPDCGAMSDVRYDLAAVELRDSPNPYLRFIDLLPVVDSTLLPDDAQYTPCVHATRLGELIGLPSLYLKDETKLPTGTTKDRMAAVALPFLRERGVTGFTTSSTGNSSSAYAYALPRVPRLLMYLFTAAAFRDRLALPPHPTAPSTWYSTTRRSWRRSPQPATSHADTASSPSRASSTPAGAKD